MIYSGIFVTSPHSVTALLTDGSPPAPPSLMADSEDILVHPVTWAHSAATTTASSLYHFQPNKKLNVQITCYEATVLVQVNPKV